VALGRIVFTVATAGWALFVWLASHRSVSPEYLGRYSREYLTFLGLGLAALVGFSWLAFHATRRPLVLPATSIAGVAGLLLGSTLVALLAAEGLVRSFDLLGASFFEEVTRYVLDLEPDRVLVYKHRAGLATTYQGIAFQTNELGLRERPLPEPSPDVLRVLVLGDSVTLGWGVRTDETFAARLEPALEARLGRPVRTINAGVSGYNTEQELAFYRLHAASLAPDLVVLVYVENDTEVQTGDIVELRHRWENPPHASALLLRWSWLYRLLYFVLPDVVGPRPVPTESEGWYRSMRALEELHRLARSNDAEFVAFLYRMAPDAVTNKSYTEIERVADQRGFPFFDTLPWFDGVMIRSVINSYVDSHPNSAGHRILAEGMARALVTSGALCRAAARNPRHSVVDGVPIEAGEDLEPPCRAPASRWARE